MGSRSESLQTTFKKTGRALSKKTAKHLLEVFKLLKAQTQQKLNGEKQIENRIVSLDELEARPIKKGKSFPNCEFGSTNQMSFNRQGFMVTCEILLGAPNDKTLYPATLEKYQQRMKAQPPDSITDQGFRSVKNFKLSKTIPMVFLGRSIDVPEDEQAFCKSARSATEGFIAVAKNLRGFRKSLYRGLRGDQIWAAFSQAAYNLRKFYLFYRDEKIEENTLISLGFLT